MSLKRCFFCNRAGETPVHLTEIGKDGKLESADMCVECGKTFMNDVYEPTEKPVMGEQNVNLDHVTTPEQLLSLLTDNSKPPMEPCECGLTEAEFDDKGRFGCPKCYTHFSNKMEELVFPYHKAKEHVGKRPKHHWLHEAMQNPVEKRKILKLRYAKALELEDYEKCAELKRELDALNAEHPQ